MNLPEDLGPVKNQQAGLEPHLNPSVQVPVQRLTTGRSGGGGGGVGTSESEVR